MSGTGEALLHPLFLKLEHRLVLVVGAGDVAGRKVTALLESGAAVRVVAPEAGATVRSLADQAKVEWRRRQFDEADADGAWLIVSATGDPETQRRVAAAGEARRRFVLAVDDPAHASAYGCATIHRPPFVVAISSSGAAPALSRLIREIIEQALPGDAWVTRARELRARWRRDGTPAGHRFDALVRDFKERAARTR